MFDYQKAHSGGFDQEELGVTQSKGEPQPKLDCKHWKEDCNHKHFRYIHVAAQVRRGAANIFILMFPDKSQHAAPAQEPLPFEPMVARTEGAKPLWSSDVKHLTWW